MHVRICMCAVITYVDFLVLTHKLYVGTYIHTCPSCGSSIRILAYLHTYLRTCDCSTYVLTHMHAYHTPINTLHIIGLLSLLLFNCPCSCFYPPAITKKADIPLGEEDPDCKGDEGSC